MILKSCTQQLLTDFQVIQGGGDGEIMKKFTKDEVSETIDFCFHALNTLGEEEPDESKATKGETRIMERLAPDDEKVVKGLHVLAKTMPMADMSDFENTNIDGLVPRVLVRGNLGLRVAGK